MHLLKLMQLCFSIFAWRSDGYVLLAANLDDFRSIAKRFVPEKLAEQLVEMAGETNNGHENPSQKNQRSGEVYYADAGEKSLETYEVDEESANNKRREEVKEYNTKAKNRDGEVKEYNEEAKQRDIEVKKYMENAKQRDDEIRKSGIIKEMTNINMDDLVEKVKERLEKDYQLKLSNTAKGRHIKYASEGKTSKKYVNNDSVGSREDAEYDDRKPIKNVESTQYIVTERVTREPEYRKPTQKYTDGSRDPKRESTSRKPVQSNTQNEYENDDNKAVYDDAAYKEVADETPKLFDAVDMLKSNDSYEDYVTPKRYQIYEGNEPTKYPKRFNVKAKTNAMQKLSEVHKSNDKAKVNTEYDYDVTPGEIKARTEDMMFEEKDIHREEISNRTGHEPKGATKKSKSGTMIPTREYYKMSSPNYYAKLPIIAEKYDFDEPIPERDREREDLRSIGNPPASINRKVKLL